MAANHLRPFDIMESESLPNRQTILVEYVTLDFPELRPRIMKLLRGRG